MNLCIEISRFSILFLLLAHLIYSPGILNLSIWFPLISIAAKIAKKAES